MPAREEAYDAIQSEREYQEWKINQHGGSDAHNHPVGDFLTFIRHYHRRAEAHLSEDWGDNQTEPLHNVRKMAALAFACMELHGAVPRVANDLIVGPCSPEVVREVVDGERDYQDNLPPERTDKSRKSVGDYLTMLDFYLGEATSNWTMHPDILHALDSLRKVAAICEHCMEDHQALFRVFNVDTTQDKFNEIRVLYTHNNIGVIKVEICYSTKVVSFDVEGTLDQARGTAMAHFQAATGAAPTVKENV